MKNAKFGSCVKISHFQYSSAHHKKRSGRSNSAEKNPIKIIIDKIEMDEEASQQMANRNSNMENQKIQKYRSKTTRSPKNITRVRSTQLSYQKPAPTSRAFVFNRFQYDNCQPFSLQKARKPDSSRKLPSSSHKNIQIVFCESKLPNFVQRTNDKIEEIYKNQMIINNQKNKNYMIQPSLNRQKITLPVKKYKITFANTLKEYGTLEKLSMFMESDQNLQERCICSDFDKDPSRTVLLDIITHRFSFMKNLSRKIRQKIYCNLFGRDKINSFTKINIYQYMRFTEMFVGRCSNPQEIASFISFVLFANQQPRFQTAKHVIEQIHGSLHKQRIILDLFYQIFTASFDNLVDVLSQNGKILKLFIDLIVEK